MYFYIVKIQTIMKEKVTENAAVAPPVKKSTWAVLSAINCNEHTEKKKSGNGVELTYLSWTWAWGILKENFPDSTYTVREWDGKPYLHDEVLGYLVETSLTVDGETLTMRLPVMDGSNKAQKSLDYEYVVKNPNFKFAKYDATRGGYFDKYGNEQPEFLVKKVTAATMFDINTAIMRCLVKNMALFGLGHYIYAGEDLPNVEQVENAEKAQREAEEMQAKYNEGIARMQACKTIEELQSVFNEYPVFAGDRAFRKICNDVGKQIKSSQNIA